MVKGICHHQPSHAPSVQHGSWRNRREEEPGLGRELDCGRSVTQLCLQPNILPQGCHCFINKLIRLDGYPRPYKCWFISPKSAGDHLGVVWIQSFHSSIGHVPALDRHSGYPPNADAPHSRCQLPAQTLRLRNHKGPYNIITRKRIFQQPGTGTR